MTQKNKKKPGPTPKPQAKRPYWRGKPVPPEYDVQDPSLDDLPRTIFHIPRLLLLLLVRGYQATFSRTLPVDTCRFYPSCSHYGYQAIYKYGIWKGGALSAWRILRCNPFNHGGFDPLR